LNPLPVLLDVDASIDKLITDQIMDAAAMHGTFTQSAGVVRIPVDPAARLRAALRMLETRLAEQREVLSAWRQDAATLSLTVRNLSDSLASCQKELDALDAKVAVAKVAALDLERTLDRLLDATGSA
jgi:uncharacterized coiled-coil protein SlyX